jgi:hypothetical protein
MDLKLVLGELVLKEGLCPTPIVRGNPSFFLDKSLQIFDREGLEGGVYHGQIPH